MMECIVAIGEKLWGIISERIVPWVLERLQSTFSASEDKKQQSIVVTSPQPDGTTFIDINAFFSVTNNMDRELCLTGVHLKKPKWGEVKTFRSFPEYIPARKTLHIHATLFIQKPTHYLLQGEYIEAILCLEGNNNRRKSIKISLINNN